MSRVAHERLELVSAGAAETQPDLDERCRQAAREMIAVALDAERRAYLDAHAELLGDDGRRPSERRQFGGRASGRAASASRSEKMTIASSSTSAAGRRLVRRLISPSSTTVGGRCLVWWLGSGVGACLGQYT